MIYKNILKFIFFLIFSVIFILGLIYLGLGYYYRNSFSFGTRINGIYCTGQSKDDVNLLLTKEYEYPGINVCIENSSLKFFIPSQDFDFSYSFDQSLDLFLATQNEWLWPNNILTNSNQLLKPEVHIDEQKLQSIFDEHDILCEAKPVDVHMYLDDGLYCLFDNTKHRQDYAKMREDIVKAIYDSETEIVLDSSYFYDEPYSVQDEVIIKDYLIIQDFLKPNITYIMGDDRINIDEAVLTSFMCKSDDGTYSWNNELIESWVDELADRYDSVGKTRIFYTTDGREITVEGGIYGNKIDRKQEKEYLVNAINDGLCEEHEPEYIQKAVKQDIDDDIGDTYIEVDMTNQKLYYYVDGELVIDTPVVTGNMIRNWDTPSGTNYVYFMQRNRTLHGANYATFVNYWIAVVGHIGIHDATWRDDFGGDIYMTEGSHGCINTPMEAVSELYELVEVGTPVVMYYAD